MVANLSGGPSQEKGIVLRKVGVEAKQPNSSIRKGVWIQITKNSKKITVFTPNAGRLNFTKENNEVLVAEFG